MDGPDYDTREGIACYLKDGLPGLHRLAKHRAAAWREREERMGLWTIMGLWVADETGGFFQIAPDCRPDPAWQEIPPVMDKAETARVLSRLSWGGGAGRHPLPPLDDMCPQCLEGWSMRNAGDLDWGSEEPRRAYHAQCLAYRRHEDGLARFRSLFMEAGYRDAALRAIPNLYGSGPWTGPWFLAETAEIGLVRVGWRKSVIEIDWSKGRAGDRLSLFAGEEITKEATLVHAYGYEKAADYLRRLRLAVAGEPAPEDRVEGGPAEAVALASALVASASQARDKAVDIGRRADAHLLLARKNLEEARVLGEVAARNLEEARVLIARSDERCAEANAMNDETKRLRDLMRKAIVDGDRAALEKLFGDALARDDSHKRIDDDEQLS